MRRQRRSRLAVDRLELLKVTSLFVMYNGRSIMRVSPYDGTFKRLADEFNRTFQCREINEPDV